MSRWQRLKQWIVEFIRQRTPGWEGTASADDLTTREKGDRAEGVAVWHLRRHGYRIVETNWWAPHRRGELDIIARTGDTLVAIEVKSYPQGDLTPRESLSSDKERRLLQLIRQYAKIKRHLDCSLRIDLIVIEWTRAGTIADIKHIESAVTAN